MTPTDPKPLHLPVRRHPQPVRPHRALLILSLIVLPTIAEAGLDEWTSGGPYGGIIADLVIDPATPTTLYVGTVTGLFKSTDAGATWSPVVDARLGFIEADVLAIAESAPDTIYSSDVDGIFKSTDGGTSWSRYDQLAQAGVVELAVDPSAPETLFAGTHSGEVYRSDNGGESWTVRSNGLESSWIRALLIDPVTPSTVYAASDQGVFRTRDSGANWEAINNGLTDLEVHSLALDPAAAATLYAMTSGGLFRTSDEGSQWQRIAPAPPGRLETLIVDPATPSRLYTADVFSRGIYRSEDGGAGWSTIVLGLTNRSIRKLVIDPQHPSILYAGSQGGGIYRTQDRGEQWSARNQGFSEGHVEALAVDPESPQVVYAGTFGGIFRSHDHGATWMESSTGLLDGFVRALAIDPKEPSTLYAGTNHGVFRSRDGGASWTSTNSGSTSVYALVVDPLQPEYVFAGGFGLFRSADSGDSWTLYRQGLPPGQITALAIDPSRPHVLYAGTGSGVFRSINRGVSWTPSTEGLGPFFIHSLAVDPVTTTTLYAGVADGVFRSLDGAASWEKMSTGLTRPVGSLAIDPVTPFRVYAGAIFGGVSISEDRGERWNGINAGQINAGPRSAIVRALAIDPTTPSTLYAGTERGVFSMQKVTSEDTLVLGGGRFKAEVEWRAPGSGSGRGKVVVVGGDDSAGSGAGGRVALRSQSSGVFEFFSASNWELLVKVLDGRAQNDHHWVFLTAASNVAYTVRISDTSCGSAASYHNPLGNAAGLVADTEAFPECAAPQPPSCQEDLTTVCLGGEGRFRVQVEWSDFGGANGAGKLSSLGRPGLGKGPESGVFSFFGGENWELLVKVLDGCALNGSFWIFGAAATDVEYTLVITDLFTGSTFTHTQPWGGPGGAFFDTEAFATCDPL